MDRAPSVADACAAGCGVGAQAGRADGQVSDDSAVARCDDEERQEETEGQGHVVQDQDTPPGRRVWGLETAMFTAPGRQKTRSTKEHQDSKVIRKQSDFTS